MWILRVVIKGNKNMLLIESKKKKKKKKEKKIWYQPGLIRGRPHGNPK